MQRNDSRNWPTALGLATLAVLGLPAQLPAQAQSYTFQSLAAFNGTNGEFPVAGLIPSPSGLFYGTTDKGGAGNGGSVFSFNPATNALAMLASFTSAVTPDNSLTLSADGSALYGTSRFGGSSNLGMIYSVPVGGGTPTVLASFTGSNGSRPYAGLTLGAGGKTLYGTTRSGGASSEGTVFSLNPATGALTTVSTFDYYINGASPQASLTLGPSGLLYGTTSFGSGNNGTVFSLNPTTRALTTLATFTGTNGNGPAAGLTLSADGQALYGTATFGGSSDDGVVFSVPVGGGAISTLAAFNLANGANPVAGLTLSADGKTLYGTTQNGGPSDGTVFSVSVGGGGVNTVVSFTGTNGAYPTAGLTLGPDGKTLYGTTQNGGPTTSLGTIFALVPPSATSQSRPILPSSTSTSGGVTTFTFTGVASGSWVDPASATSFTLKMTGNALFTGITGFPTGFTSPFDVTAGGKDYGLFTPGKALAFDGLGVSSFLISGISPSVDASSPNAFPLQLTFNTLNADFTMTAAPEPSQWAVFGLGVMALGGLGRRARWGSTDRRRSRS